jgi:hypothetical protein
MRAGGLALSMRRVLFNPITSLVLLVLLLADAAMLPSSPWAGGVSKAGWFIQEHLRDRGLWRSQPPPPKMAPTLFFVRGSGSGFEVLEPEREEGSYDRPTRELRDRPRDVLQMRYSPIQLRSGWWAVTRQLDRHEIKTAFGENFTPEERAATRRQYVERSGALAWLSREDFETLAVQDIDRTRPIVMGYVHNTVSAVGLVLFLVSLAWVPRIPGWARAWRGRARLAAGRCPGCGYAIAGLPGGVCPECGGAIPGRA